MLFQNVSAIEGPDFPRPVDEIPADESPAVESK